MIDNSLETSVGRLFSYMKKDTEVKECFYHDCSQKPIRAHSIQNNRILCQIARDGVVLKVGFIPTAHGLEIDLVEEGRGKASTFPGFCNEHDTKLFLPIESKEYMPGDLEQEYLFAYRALAKEHNTKQRALRVMEKAVNMREREYEDVQHELGLHLRCGLDFAKEMASSARSGTLESLRMLEDERTRMNVNLDRRRFSKIKTRVIEILGEHGLTASSLFLLEQDSFGNMINDLESYREVKPTFLTVIPQGNSTFVLVANHRRDDVFFEFLDEQLIDQSTEKQKVIISNMLAQYVENVFFSPAKWEQVSSRQKGKYREIFEKTLIGPAGPLAIDPAFNLFD